MMDMSRWEGGDGWMMTKDDVQRRFRLTTQISFAVDSLSSLLILIVSLSLLILSRLNSQFHLLRLSDISASPLQATSHL